MKAGRTNFRITVVGLSFIAAYIVLKFLPQTALVAVLKSALMLIFFTLWAATIKWRTVKSHVRSCLLIVAIMEFCWVLIRTIKFEFIKTPEALRLSWYLYYLPMLMIPTFTLLLSVSMGKPENHKPRKFLVVFPITALLLFAFVVTNDLHGAVFIVPPGVEGVEVGNYSYGFGYPIVMIYIAACVIASYGILITKCRIPRTPAARILPVIPLIIGAAVCLLNAFGIVSYFGSLLTVKIDITAAVCFCAATSLEACIQNGLIPNNSCYDEIFRESGIRAVITDNNYNILISSDTCGEISPSEMKSAEKRPQRLKNGFRLSSAQIKHGRVLWQDDIFELDKVISELSLTNDYLQGKSAAIQKANEYQKRSRRLIEKNRLYNQILSKTRAEIELYAALVEQTALEKDREKARDLAVKTAFVSSFIKRRDNLIFLSEQDKLIDPSELYFCVEESLSNLRLTSVRAECSNTLKKPLGFAEVTSLYETFYRVTFALIDNISDIFVYLLEEDQAPAVLMRISFNNFVDHDNNVYFDNIEKTISSLGQNITTTREGEEWVVKICR